ncbi:hypothetical protein ACQ859_27230 [Roseateles chitinivorans]|uniref:hypothetical protein n=1 Tax=Roseateles chitinivorans TaxID=2917965 RepID=UPI003D66BBB2
MFQELTQEEIDQVSGGMGGSSYMAGGGGDSCSNAIAGGMVGGAIAGSAGGLLGIVVGGLGGAFGGWMASCKVR